jgi:hypothetical protein
VHPRALATLTPSIRPLLVLVALRFESALSQYRLAAPRVLLGVEHRRRTALLRAAPLLKRADLVRRLVNSHFLYCVYEQQKSRQAVAGESLNLEGPTGLEPATSGVSGTGGLTSRAEYGRYLHIN